jgi:hypothetical protein
MIFHREHLPGLTVNLLATNVALLVNRPSLTYCSHRSKRIAISKSFSWLLVIVKRCPFLTVAAAPVSVTRFAGGGTLTLDSWGSFQLVDPDQSNLALEASSFRQDGT